jgi:hypothetical protein
MDMNYNITIKLSPEELKNIIAEYISKETGRRIKSDNIKFLATYDCVGYGMNEYYETVFKGCEIDCKRE